MSADHVSVRINYTSSQYVRLCGARLYVGSYGVEMKILSMIIAIGNGVGVLLAYGIGSEESDVAIFNNGRSHLPQHFNCF